MVLRFLLQMLKILTIAAMSVLVVAGSIRLFDYAVDAARPAETGRRIQFSIAQDEPAGQVAERLAAVGLIRSTVLFEGQVRLSGRDLVPGTYSLKMGMSSPQIVDRITGVATEEPEEVVAAGPPTFSITIPEGWRIEQIAQEYEKLGGEGGYDAFMEAVAAVDRSQYDFLADLDPSLPLEGFLFPDTYTFSATDPAINVATMLENFGAKFDASMRTRTVAMGLTIPDVVTVASLVEREAQVPAERPIIADVYLSRWEQGWELEADPTVQYVLGNRNEWWPTLSGDDLFVESPYNTYQVVGLPPGPICNPGLGSLQAVLYPEETPYMFFVAKQDGTGEHAFAATKEEQDANVARYLGGDGVE